MKIRKVIVGFGLLLGVGIPLPALPQAKQDTTTQGTVAQGNQFDVRGFGAKGDGRTLDTQAIEKAIRAANAAGGGTVVFHPGVYVAGTFELLSNVTLDLEVGAVIQGSGNMADYGSITDFGFGRDYGVNYTGEGLKVGLIVAQNASNIGIIGQGVIDGNSNAFFDFTKPHYSMDFDPQYTRQGEKFMDTVLATGDGPAAVGPNGRAGTMIIFSSCTNVLMRDITLRNAPNWTVHLANAQHVVVEGVHVLNDVRVPNDDGFDCIGCRDAHFSDSYIRTGDDDFAIVGSEGVTITNCSLVSNSSGIRLENTRGSVFSNLTIDANRGIGIYDRGKGKTASVVFSNMVIDTHLLTGHWWGKGEPIYIAIGGAEGNAGVVRDVRFSNITGDAENGIVLYGAPGAWIRDISFEGVRFRFRVTRPEVNAEVGGNFDLRWTTDSLKTGIFKHDIPGLYARYVDGLKLHDFEIQWAEAMPDYYSSALELEDFDNLSVDDFRGRQALVNSDNPAIALRRGKGVSIRNSTADAGSSTFLSASDVAGQLQYSE